MPTEKCLQEIYAPHNACYGCGPANQRGLKVRSFVEGDLVVANWTPESHHEAFPGVLNGGIIGSILDCHCNWTAAWHLMQKQGVKTPPCTVTMEYHIKLRRPTPSDQPLSLQAWVEASTDDVASVRGELYAGGKLCDVCTGKFMAVKPGHPAYHRW
ncbi:acyl-coenzyme A thioesterase PaaI-like protein [Natronospira proteinivora]|uniref:Acyl-coenzyme A thioesterase PaaI-like protein n=1 Tax=Natronospira proteinivora TaxID=1807133 RepID=A0ABT1GAZ3_9GAMM|nr:PaaI family thioesterase [Natronospira proteinivora]MCP1728490.1 acyl-coenzyme A thioesterase PaaI-like protein [Natronospira proteinivora]